MDKVRSLEEEAQENSLSELEKNGMTVTVLTDDQKQEWIDATSGILDEYKDQAGEEIINRTLEILGR